MGAASVRHSALTVVMRVVTVAVIVTVLVVMVLTIVRFMCLMLKH